MSVAILLVGAAEKMRIPYPIVLVLGGAILGFIPYLKAISFDPNLILVVVLPPILYIGAYQISFREFKRNSREIFSLALGLVVVTTFVIGILFKWFFPQLPWALAFAFGALISPPDAITATTILKRFAIGPRLQTILEGESLINDAFALVLYRLTIAALLTGVFSWSEASFEFFKVVIGGIIVGLIAGFTMQVLSFRFLPSIIGAMFSFVIPYITYIIAESLGASGVLAVVINGLFLAWQVAKHHDSHRHLVAITVWDIFTILLNCFVFILIGLQLTIITQQMTLQQIGLYIGYAFVITVVMIVIRMIWINAGHVIAYLQARYKKKTAEYCTQILREGIVLGWSGMRGIVSLTAVLALPFTTSGGTPLAGRDIVIFVTFFVILLTLLIPGLTLPTLLTLLNIRRPETQIVHHVRKKLLKTAEQEIQIFTELDEEEGKFLLNYFSLRHRIFEITSSTESQLKKLEIARRKILHAQRHLLQQMLENREIDNKLMKLLEMELDLEESLSVNAEI